MRRRRAAAHEAGVGAEIEVTLGGSIDPARFPPMQVTAQVKLLSDGAARLETMRAPLQAGPTAVLTFGNFTVVVMSRSVSLFDRAMYFANGLDPRDFDLVVVKSPHTEHHMFDAWSEKNFNIDAPGATSANLKSLGHTICARPIFSARRERRLRAARDGLSALRITRPAARPRSPCRRSAAMPGATSFTAPLSLVTACSVSATALRERRRPARRIRPCSVIASCSPSRVTARRTRASSGWRLAISATCSGRTNMPLTLVVWSARPIQPLMRVLVRPQGEAPASTAERSPVASRIIG